MYTAADSCLAPVKLILSLMSRRASYTCTVWTDMMPKACDTPSEIRESTTAFPPFSKSRSFSSEIHSSISVF